MTPKPALMMMKKAARPQWVFDAQRELGTLARLSTAMTLSGGSVPFSA